MTNQDFFDLFSTFNAFEVRYLVVGGYAVTFHTRPRFTKDLEVWIDPSPENALRAWRALAAYGAPVSDLSPSELSKLETVFQIGVPPNRIDLLTSLEAVAFEVAWNGRVVANYGACPVAYLGLDDLIANKRAVGGPQDLVDAESLEHERARRLGGV